MRFIVSYYVSFVFLVFVAVFFPVAYVQIANDTDLTLSLIVLGSLGVTLFICSSCLLLKNVHVLSSKILLVVLLISSLFIRLSYAFSYDFSGRGFTSEFFAHVSWKSVSVSLSEYGVLFFVIFFLLLTLLSILIYLVNNLKTRSVATPLAGFIFSALLIWSGANAMPEMLFTHSYYRYSSSEIDIKDRVLTRAESLNTLTPIRGKVDLPIDKSALIASLPSQPKNLIIIYLESFSDILTNSAKYPGLTPNLDRLKQENISFSNNYSSGYVTIEGIANSQCGTLMNMDSGNNSLTSSAGRLPNLPCLGDILKAANYTQVFYGGADLDFAGKGLFLTEHGYDEVRGMAEWSKLGYTAESTWGLTDSNLFKEALTRVDELHANDTLFNLTLLTLGTHTPGFVYDGCAAYSEVNASELFLDAIHCTDKLVGDFVSALNEKGVLEDTVVYIQGDHSIFPTSGMKSMFGAESKDKRIFNAIIHPEKDTLSFDAKSPTATTNMAANVLDLLTVSHNTDFIFSNSDFDDSQGSTYFMTRYEDYFGFEKINNFHGNDNCSDDDAISIPLDFCEKAKAINSVYQLGASYSDFNNSQLCDKGVSVDLSDTVTIDWGGIDISNNFYLNGFPLSKFKKGIYLIVLSRTDQVLKQLFFDVSNKDNAKTFQSYIKTGLARYIVISNLTATDVDYYDLDDSMGYYADRKVSYIINNTDIIYDSLNGLAEFNYIRFFPESCQQNRRLTVEVKFKSNEPKGFCKINNWGPKVVSTQEGFNVQPDGDSAFWLLIDCAPPDTVIRLNKVVLDTTLKLPVIAGTISSKHIPLNGNEEYVLDLYSPSLGLVGSIGEVEVLANPGKIIEIEMLGD